MSIKEGRTYLEMYIQTNVGFLCSVGSGNNGAQALGLHIESNLNPLANKTA